MALSQALSTGITGLMTHQKAMDNIGNNLANVNTVGFKKGVYQFATLLEQSLRGGIGADATTGRGSINPIAMGLGAVTGSINKAFIQGPIENTGNSTDMAINGNGFFVLRQENGFAYTRSGSFYRGEDGYLMAADGLYVQGTMAVKGANGAYSIPQDAKMQNILIPIGQIGGHTQTTQVEFTGNLDSRQELSAGTRLFGSTSFPTVASLQKWMWKDFDGGTVEKKPNVDTTWNALEQGGQGSFAISQNTLSAYAGSIPGGISLPANVTRYANGVVPDVDPNSLVYWALDVSDPANPVVRELGNPESVDGAQRAPVRASDLPPGHIPLIQELNVINGGNVQTSAAYGVKVPGLLVEGGEFTGPDGGRIPVGNAYTFPQWFYESTGAAMPFERIAALTNEDFEVRPDETLRAIWPNGINSEGWGTTGQLNLASNMPRAGDEYAASLTTPLENVQYRKGNVWVQPFSNIKNGDEITVGFTKGQSKIEATFVYNRPRGFDPGSGQQQVDREQSFTLEHFLKFMGGDVDEPSVAGVNITPAMFGAPVTPEHPYGNYNAAVWDGPGKAAYDRALADIDLAKTGSNYDTHGGAMGLLSIPPQISDANGGSDAYDTPVESAGAYSRSGVSTVNYFRYDPILNKMVETPGNSFNLSLVSNLGKDNAISDVTITYNNVPHEGMFEDDRKLAEPQGGSSSVTVDYYDSLGNPKKVTMRMAMVSQDDNFTTWRWYADSVDDSDFAWQADPATGELMSNLNVGTGLIRFDKDGNFVRGSTFSETDGILVNQKNQGVNEPVWIKVMNGLSSGSKQMLDFSELTCSAINNTFKLGDQNGRPPGTLNDFSVDYYGVIMGVYSNGNTVALARLGLAMIPNETGLVAAGANLYYTSPASGDALYGHANTGGAGKIHHKQLETSNVDLSEEFTKLISTERGFQANSRTITTADEMITELLNLKR